MNASVVSAQSTQTCYYLFQSNYTAAAGIQISAWQPRLSIKPSLSSPPPCELCLCIWSVYVCEREAHTHTHHTDALLLLTLVSNNPFDQDDLNSETFLMFAIVFFKYT